MSTTSRISELSTRIAINTAKIDEYLISHGLPQPSFAIDAPLQSVIPNDEVELTTARQEVIHDTLELRRLMLGPREHLSSFSGMDLASQQAVTRFRLAHAFPVGSEITFEELANRVGLGETHIKKLVRHAITLMVFNEPRPGVITHSACSRLIAEDDVFYSFMRFNSDDVWRSTVHVCDAIEKWPGSEEPNQTGFAIAHATDKSMFAYLSDHPEKATDFYKAMRAFTKRPGHEPKYVVEGYGWGSLPDGATIVDLGGSHGIVAIELARANPTLQFVVQDLDETIIKDADAKKPADVAERVRFMVHDFLTPQPISAALYFFRMIFHNWPDKYCIQILRQLVPVLIPGSKIVIVDSVVPDPGTLPSHREAMLRGSDLHMLAMQNSGERELGEWKRLFQQADERFSLQQAFQPKGAAHWILEAVWNG